MPIYNKLVRDKIPAIIKSEGKTLSTNILSDEQYLKELRIKLQEEMQEYLEAPNDVDSIEELADVLEVIHSLTVVHNSSVKELEQVRKQKAEKRGGFEERIFLKEVIDD
ncbi:nucleoside triphosphate pyrophosphohydrolase [Alkalicoccobacillus porphyridii]|uniref:Phosphoribosyl-ATP pyrophosphohydrolase n=1 Tax=Alkalicoccobacillus porphyridii TaxID=2597270 RepID=A0A553ZWB6_9BACI|nr:nucleoside triphosphate pyrophosphohydrolase [Alkalicoccobacillus porphyridii]TSB45723.1 phosphoribosyl-ATP pyrophosphohydrolase [Alkalicoccobacillus porphyridii]